MLTQILNISYNLIKYFFIVFGPFLLLCAIAFYISLIFPIIQKFVSYIFNGIPYTLSEYQSLFSTFILWISFPLGTVSGYYYFKRKNDIDNYKHKLLIFEENINKLHNVLSEILHTIFVLSVPNQGRDEILHHLFELSNWFYSTCEVLLALGADEILFGDIIKLYSFLDKNIESAFFEEEENRKKYTELHMQAYNSIIRIRKEFIIKSLMQS